MEEDKEDKEDNLENDNMQLYLQNLKKKVDHHHKNPFQVSFISYTFEELNNCWSHQLGEL